MIELGKIQKLKMIREASIGIYLNSEEPGDIEDILLPRKQVPEDINVGDEIQVFVYRDSKDRLIATVNQPKITLGEFKMLKVVEKTEIGAFLEWGLERDLFLPFKEQTIGIEVGKEYFIGLYIDKTNRLCGSMNAYKLLSFESPYKVDDKVWGTVYSIKSQFGAFVAVDDKYQGLINNNQLFRELKIGEKVEARVIKVKDDGKLDLSIRDRAYLEMDKDSHVILAKLEIKGGFINLNDSSSPEKIKSEFNISKNAFKRAVGRLLKEGMIVFKENGIALVEEEPTT